MTSLLGLIASVQLLLLLGQTVDASNATDCANVGNYPKFVQRCIGPHSVGEHFENRLSEMGSIIRSEFSRNSYSNHAEIIGYFVQQTKKYDKHTKLVNDVCADALAIMRCVIYENKRSPCGLDINELMRREEFIPIGKYARVVDEANIKNCSEIAHHIEKALKPEDYVGINMENECGYREFMDYGGICSTEGGDAEYMEQMTELVEMVSRYNLTEDLNPKWSSKLLVNAILGTQEHGDLKRLMTNYCSDINYWMACIDKKKSTLSCKFDWKPFLGNDQWMTEVGKKYESIKELGIQSCTMFANAVHKMI